MKSSKLTPFLNKIVKGTSKHSPAILVGFGIVGAAAAIVSGIRVTPKAVKLLEEKKEVLETEKLPGKEIVKTVWKLYVPCAVSFAGSVACILTAQSVNMKRQTAFATAYALSEAAFSDYKEEVKNVIGEKKEREIKDKVAAKKIKEKPVTQGDIVITGKGNTICFDTLSGRYFRSDINQIKSAVNELNMGLSTGMDYCSLNDFYEELGIPPTALGDDLGWNVTKDGLIDVDYSSQLTPNDEPCLVIEYTVAPRYDYSSYY